MSFDNGWITETTRKYLTCMENITYRLYVFVSLYTQKQDDVLELISRQKCKVTQFADQLEPLDNNSKRARKDLEFTMNKFEKKEILVSQRI